MSRSNFVLRVGAILALAVLIAVPASTVYGQNYGGNNNNYGGGNNNNWGGGNNRNNNNNNTNNNHNNNSGGNRGGGGGYGSGVVIDARGVLQRTVVDDGFLAAARNEAYHYIPSDMRAPSKLRKVYPETGDVVIAGPAEGWIAGVDGSVVGVKSGRPTLRLEDLVVALRAFPAKGDSASVVGCSIDPTEAGLRDMQYFIRNAPHPVNDYECLVYAAGLREALGLQAVRVWGVSPKTNFAATLVAADYRMKLIGIGLEESPVKLVTYAAKSNPRVNPSNGLVRWYFQPNYDCVIETENGDAIELIGNGVNLVGEDELVSEDGTRSANKGRGNPATRAYAKSFTSKFEKIADQVPVYASLRNLIDMTIVAAYLQKEDVYAKTNWTPDFFADEDKFQTEYLNAVQFAETAVNTIRHGGGPTSYPTGGGVHIELAALDADHIQYDDKGEVTKTRQGRKSRPQPVVVD